MKKVPADQRRDVRVNFLVTRAAADALSVIAAINQQSVSDFCCDLVAREIKKNSAAAAIAKFNEGLAAAQKIYFGSADIDVAADTNAT